MSIIEKEVKILDINVKETIQKLILLGAEDKGVKKFITLDYQKINGKHYFLLEKYDE